MKIIPLILILIFLAGISLASEENLYISEFFPNPGAVSDSKGEWMEIYNNSNIAINLNGYKLTVNNSEFIIAQDLIIESKKALVLCNHQNINENGGIECDFEYSGLSLINSGGTVSIEKDDFKNEISYDAGDVESSYSIEVCDFLSESLKLSENQLPSGDYASPGVVTESCSDEAGGDIENESEEGDEIDTENQNDEDLGGVDEEYKKNLVLQKNIRISEALPNPEGSDEDNNEFIELYNANDQKVNISGMYLKNEDDKKYELSLSLKSKEYLALYRSEFGFVLTNSKEKIYLYSADEKLVDEVAYEKAKSGFSYNFDINTLDYYWSQSLTPGARNKKDSVETEIKEEVNINKKDSDKKEEQESKYKKIDNYKDIIEGEDDRMIELTGVILNDSHQIKNNRFYLRLNEKGVLIEPSLEFDYIFGETVKIKGKIVKNRTETYIFADEIKKINKKNYIKPVYLNDINKGSLLKVKGNLVLVEAEFLSKNGSFYYFLKNNQIVKSDFLNDSIQIEKNNFEFKSGYQYKLKGIIEVDSSGVKLLMTDFFDKDYKIEKQSEEYNEYDSILIKKPEYPIRLNNVKIYYPDSKNV